LKHRGLFPHRMDTRDRHNGQRDKRTNGRTDGRTIWDATRLFVRLGPTAVCGRSASVKKNKVKKFKGRGWNSLKLLPPDVTDAPNSIPGVCLSVRPFVCSFQTPSKRRTDGRTDWQYVRPSVRVLAGDWHYGLMHILATLCMTDRRVGILFAYWLAHGRRKMWQRGFNVARIGQRWPCTGREAQQPRPLRCVCGLLQSWMRL